VIDKKVFPGCKVGFAEPQEQFVRRQGVWRPHGSDPVEPHQQLQSGMDRFATSAYAIAYEPGDADG
jgi:hypothetical protein